MAKAAQALPNVTWAVCEVSVLKTPEQVQNPDPILQLLLDEAEFNLQWSNFYREERCKIYPGGLGFLQKPLFRRIQIVASYLHALRDRKLREVKPTASVPFTVFVEITLRKLDSDPACSCTGMNNSKGRIRVIPFAEDSNFISQPKFLMTENVVYARVVLKLEVNNGAKISKRGKKSKLTTIPEETDSEIPTDETKMKAWLEKKTEIEQIDAEGVFRNGDDEVGSAKVVLLKPFHTTLLGAREG